MIKIKISWDYIIFIGVIILVTSMLVGVTLDRDNIVKEYNKLAIKYNDDCPMKVYRGNSVQINFSSFPKIIEGDKG